LISYAKRRSKLKRNALNYESWFRCEQYEKQEIMTPEILVIIVEPVKELLFQDLFVKYIETNDMKPKTIMSTNISKRLPVSSRRSGYMICITVMRLS
jgi:hypothetical protein